MNLLSDPLLDFIEGLNQTQRAAQPFWETVILSRLGWSALLYDSFFIVTIL